MMNKNDIIHAICSTLKGYPYVLRAELFGSQQRNEARAGSDVDIIVRFDQKTRPKGLGIYEVELALEEKLGLSVDLVQEHLLYDCVRKGIGSARELIYEKDISAS
ncbi:MAG: nucleotidyltransferase domain-containing protein [Pseudomonadota bacterium]